jgi:hypothetical protein
MRQQVPDVELGRAQGGVVEIDEADLLAEQHLLLVQITVNDGDRGPLVVGQRRKRGNDRRGDVHRRPRGM